MQPQFLDESGISEARARLAQAESGPVSEVVVSFHRRVGASIALGGFTFLVTYMIFHALHVFGVEPPRVLRLSAIPLFATCGVGAWSGGLTAALGLFMFGNRRLLIQRMPQFLAVATVLYTAEMLLLP